MNIQFIKPFYMDEVKEVRYDSWLIFSEDEADVLSEYEIIDNENYREIYIPSTTLLNYIIEEGDKQAYDEFYLLAKLYADQYNFEICLQEESFREICDELKRSTYRGISLSALIKRGEDSSIKYTVGCAFLRNKGLNSSDRSQKKILEEKKYNAMLKRIEEESVEILSMNDQDLRRTYDELKQTIDWNFLGFKTPSEKEAYYKIVVIEKEMQERSIPF